MIGRASGAREQHATGAVDCLPIKPQSWRHNGSPRGSAPALQSSPCEGPRDDGPGGGREGEDGGCRRRENRKGRVANVRLRDVIYFPTGRLTWDRPEVDVPLRKHYVSKLCVSQVVIDAFRIAGVLRRFTLTMSEFRHGANVELSDFFRLAAPLIVQMDDQVSAEADQRRPVGERRAHRRAAAAGRPPGSGARRNERERNRVRQVNAGFDRLRDHVPQGRRNRKLSKVDTLRAAVEYIAHLQAILGRSDSDEGLGSDENYLEHVVTGSDVIDSWYLNPRAPADESMMQLLFCPDDITRALGGGSSSTSSAVDHLLTVDVCCSSSSPPPDRSSCVGSAGCGDCATPDSLDQEVTSSTGSDVDEQQINFSTWFDA